MFQKHAAASFTYTLYVLNAPTDSMYCLCICTYRKSANMQKKNTWKLLSCLPSEPIFSPPPPHFVGVFVCFSLFFAFNILLRMKINILTLVCLKINVLAALMLKINKPSRKNCRPPPLRIKWSSP